MIFRYLVYAFLFLVPWQTRWIIETGQLNNAKWEYGTISLYGTDILLLLIIIFFLLRKKKGEDKKAVRSLHRLFLIFYVYLMATIPFSLDPLLSIIKLISLGLAVTFIYTAGKTNISFTTATFSFLGGAVLSAMLGIWQFVTQNSFASTWLGLSEHDSNMLGTSVVEAIAPDGITERWLRAYGSLDHPNIFGGFVAIALVIAVWLWFSRQDKKKKLERYFLLASTVFLSMGVLVSFSRTAWIIALGGIIAVVITHLGHIKKQKFETFSILGIIIAVFIFAFSQYHYIFLSRFNPTERLEQISTGERQAGLEASIQLWTEKPIQGFGLNMYTLALSREDTFQPSWYYQPVHNIFLLVLVETGIIGLILLVLILRQLWYSLYEKTSWSQKSLGITLGFSLLMIALFDHWLWSLHFGILLTVSLFTLLILHHHEELLTE